MTVFEKADTLLLSSFFIVIEQIVNNNRYSDEPMNGKTSIIFWQNLVRVDD